MCNIWWQTTVKVQCLDTKDNPHAAGVENVISIYHGIFITYVRILFPKRLLELAL
jgi:hypothetical protein